jgi:hypothetical protein
MIHNYILLSLSLILLGFIFKAVCDTLKFHFSTSIFNRQKLQYWWGTSSWTNCYKDHDYKKGEKFFGSSTVFIMFMDAWHCFDFLRSIAFISAFTVYAFDYSFWLFLLLTIVIFMGGSMIFEFLYSDIFKKDFWKK